MCTNKLTSEIFIDRSNQIHNNKFDYSLTDYKNNKTKVNIICPIHGTFEQRPKEHLSGKDCYKCGLLKISLTKTKPTDVFVNESIQIHNDRFDYSLVSYKNTHSKVKIICSVHGEFKQTPSNHLKGHGCPNCTYNNSNLLEFIQRGNLIHNNKYDYSLVNYEMSKIKVKIICPSHGIFHQSPDKHLNSEFGCPSCKESKGEREIRQYLLKNNINFIPQQRFPKCKHILPLPFDFYLPDYNICIEYNGRQHYEPIKHFGGEIAFKTQQKRDLIKINYCIKHNIKLIVIKYNQSPNKILIKTLTS